jgi:5'-nucleotidase
MVGEVIISNPEKYKKIKNKIKRDGLNKLHILSDFDRTVTYSLDKEGKHTVTVFSQLRKKPDYLGQKYFDESHKLFDIYHTIEIDNSISLDEKKIKMHEWWMKHLNLLAEVGLNKNLIKRVVNENPLYFRKYSLEAFSFLNENNIPILFMSASPGDLLIEYLKQHNLNFPNVYVLANRYNFDSKGQAVKIMEPIIHTFNKTEITLKNTPIYEKIKERKNVLLLGDSLGDVGMIEGFDYDNLLKVGFLNENVEENLGKYKENFDVVITHDGDFNFINNLLKDLK